MNSPQSKTPLTVGEMARCITELQKERDSLKEQLETTSKINQAHREKLTEAVDNGAMAETFKLRLEKENQFLTEQLEKAEHQKQIIATSMGLFASVIKSGEQWTNSCDEMYKKGRDALYDKCTTGNDGSPK